MKLLKVEEDKILTSVNHSRDIALHQRVTAKISFVPIHMKMKLGGVTK